MYSRARARHGYGIIRSNLRTLRESPASAHCPNVNSHHGVIQRGVHHQASHIFPSGSVTKNRPRWLLPSMVMSVVGLGAVVEMSQTEMEQRSKGEEAELTEIVNWSGTHSVETGRYYQPENLDELKDLVHQAHLRKEKLRPVGSALSPNGLGLEKGGMVNLVLMDKILEVDVERETVKVQAGATVNQVVDALRPHGLTLENFASITEQQVGGFIQVGAHGTGVQIPPVDEQVVGLRMVTPAVGELELSLEDDDPALFQVARTAMGLMGVVAEVTLRCVPAHRLVEKTVVMSVAEVKERHQMLMAENRHLRYMWIPHTDSVVVVTCNPMVEVADEDKVRIEDVRYTNDERLAVTRALLLDSPRCRLNEAQVRELSFMALRDELLAIDPLNVDWVKKVNFAEADFWRKSQGTRVDWSDRILQFDCGGQQWVSEVAFPVKKKSPVPADVQYVQNLMQMIEEERIPAHSPIEQRWTAPSLSPMSPAGEKPDKELAATYSWVGIIMYLPDATLDKDARKRITSAFKAYKGLCEERLWSDANAVEHWAKIEMPDSAEGKARLQLRTYQKYPVEAFKSICRLFDPHGILRNDLMDTILGLETEAKAIKVASSLE